MNPSPVLGRVAAEIPYFPASPLPSSDPRFTEFGNHDMMHDSAIVLLMSCGTRCISQRFQQ